jgi:hypothetical protein
VNLARFVFLDPRTHLLHPNWSDSARTSIGILRTEAGSTPHNKGLTDLIGELSTRSEEFRRCGRPTMSGCTEPASSTFSTRWSAP